MILVRYSGDIATKARQTRNQFTRRLADNLRDAFKAEGLRAGVRHEWNRTYIESESLEAADVARRVFGIQSVSAGQQRPWSTLEDIVSAGTEIFAPMVVGKRFAVRANRLGKSLRIPFRSGDVERALGATLLPASEGVNLTRPDFTAYVEVSPGKALFFPDRAPGHGGLPIGIQGRALALVSGGFDSAVAAWMLLKRGLALDYLFLNLGGDLHEESTLRVIKVIADRWSYGYRPRLHSVDLRPFVKHMQDHVRERYLQVVLKRIMLRIGEKISRRGNAVALVTGDAVGQVSSQTLQNLAVISRATELTVLRPLIGFNKDEIIDRARLIGTYDLSASVPEYCALTPKKPATRAALEAVEAEESSLDFTLLEALVDEAATYQLRTLDLGAFGRADLEVQEVPPGAALIDLRSPRLFELGHPPGAQNLDYVAALKAFSSFDRTRTYILICDVGFKSAHVADEMRKSGFSAYHVRGGARKLMKRMGTVQREG